MIIILETDNRYIEVPDGERCNLAFQDNSSKCSKLNTNYSAFELFNFF